MLQWALGPWDPLRVWGPGTSPIEEILLIYLEMLDL